MERNIVLALLSPLSQNLTNCCGAKGNLERAEIALTVLGGADCV